ncbi:MAG: 6-bladed beta-propeller [Balneolaceae bacterium]|nr:6-bladed beta-propeller [Balneolaceae bacterium]
MHRYVLVLLFIGILISRCNREHKIDPEVQVYAEDEKLTVFKSDIKADTVYLIKDQFFGDIEDYYFSVMGDFTVDDSGRVYIADGAWGSRSLHVFSPDGSYVTQIAGEGKGPGEFLSLYQMQYRDGKLLYNDGEQFRLNLYDTETLELEEIIATDPEKWSMIDDIQGFNVRSVYLISRNRFLVGFELPVFQAKSKKREEKFYYTDRSFELDSNQVYKHQADVFVSSNIKRKGSKHNYVVIKNFPFFERSLLVLTSDGHVFTARTGEFLINEHDAKGNYLRSFYYPTPKVPVSRENAMAISNDLTEDIARDVELPEHWPVLNKLYVDDEDRLWVSTFTEGDYYKWYVLERSGKLIARFNWPGKRNRDSNSLKNKTIIKDGYFYKREEDPDTGQKMVVRYKIEFVSR